MDVFYEPRELSRGTIIDRRIIVLGYLGRLKIRVNRFKIHIRRYHYSPNTETLFASIFNPKFSAFGK